jgi:hypothetical protein
MLREAGLRGLLLEHASAPGELPVSGAARREVGRQIEEAFAVGYAMRKSGAAQGRERLLSGAQRRLAERALTESPGEVRAALEQGLGGIGGPAAPLARALYLKAVGARLAALSGSDPDRRLAALGTLEAFAARLDGMDEASLLSRATVLDLDAETSTSDFDPLGYDDKRGTVHDRGRGDTYGDNDGLFQRFMGSCGPTTMQMLLCEADPVRAFVVHDAGVASDATGDVVAGFQAELLSQLGSATLSRRVNHRVARLRNGLGRLKRYDRVSDPDARALRRHVEEDASLTAGAGRALAALRELASGFPTAAEITEMRADAVRGEDGLTLEQFEDMVERHLEPVTGVAYRRVADADGFSPRQLGSALDGVERALRKGHDVPFGMSRPGHYLMMSAVRSRGGERQFLVSDPWSGRTAWVPEAELASGSFTVEPFGLSWPEAPGYVDTLYLPEARG